MVTSDQGEWFPRVEPDDSFSLDTLVRRLHESFPALSSSQLRELIKNPEAAAFVKEGMSKQLPLANFYGSNLLDLFLTDGISGKEMARELVKEFTHPSIFIRHYLEGNPKALKVFSVLPQFEQKMHASLVEAQEEIKPHVKFVLEHDREVVEAVRKFVKRLRFVESSTSYLRVDELSPHLQQAIEKQKFLKRASGTLDSF